jgi:hypothetical protein
MLTARAGCQCRVKHRSGNPTLQGKVELIIVLILVVMLRLFELLELSI